MEIMNEYVVAAIMAICLAIGYIIKRSLYFIKNDYIPLIMGILGILLNVWYSGWNFTPDILLGGLASGLASTGAFEAVRNIGKSDDEV